MPQKQNIFKIFLILCFLFFSAVGEAKAQTACTMTVAQDGSGNYTTIQAAANAAVAGDVVCVKSGTYNERLIPANSGTVNNYIKFIVKEFQYRS